MRHRFFIPSMALLVAGTLGGCAHDAPVNKSLPPLQATAQVDLSRYMGTWYVIGNIPQGDERGSMQMSDDYKLRPDGKIEITYHYRKGFNQPLKTSHGVASLVEPSNPARWKMRSLWPEHADYEILAVAPDYSSALVGLSSRKLLWILARQPQMPEADYQRLMQAAVAQGYSAKDVFKMPQRPQDDGAPGFQSDF